MISSENTKPQGSRPGASENALPGRLDNGSGSRRERPLAACPVRSFTVEYRFFSRYVIAPRWRDRKLSPGALEALRMEAAWRTIRAGLRTNSVDQMLKFGPRMASAWTRMAMLPNCPPPFMFDELDAVRMVLDAKSFRAVDA